MSVWDGVWRHSRNTVSTSWPALRGSSTTALTSLRLALMFRVATMLLGVCVLGYLGYVDPDALQSTCDREQEVEESLATSLAVR